MRSANPEDSVSSASGTAPPAGDGESRRPPSVSGGGRDDAVDEYDGDGDDDRRRRRLEDLIAAAAYTNAELLSRILSCASAVSYKDRCQKWIVSPFGRDEYGQIAASFLVTGVEEGGRRRVLPSTLMDTVAESYRRYRDHHFDRTNGREGGVLGVSNEKAEARMSPGDLLAATAKALGEGDLHRRRLLSALEAVAENSADLEPRRAAEILRGASIIGDEELQRRCVELLISAVGGNAANIFGAVRVPVLRMLSASVLEESGVLPRYRDAVRPEWDNDAPRDNDASHDDGRDHELRQVRAVALAADLAAQGRKRASHGCVIAVPRKCFDRPINTDDGDAGVGGGGRGNGDDGVVSCGHHHRYDISIGYGYNHNAISTVGNGGIEKKRVLHAEVHAIADAMRRYGVERCLTHLFPNATAVVVELDDGGASYEDAPPCPKCHQTLRAVGIGRVCHTTAKGVLDERNLGGARPEFRRNDVVRVPLGVALEEAGVDDGWLDEPPGEGTR